MTIIVSCKTGSVSVEQHTPLNCDECPYRRTVTSEAIRLGRLTLHNERALWDGRPVPLTAGEYRLLHALANARGVVISYRTLYDIQHYKGFLAGNGEDGWRNNVRCMIKKIRQKFGSVDPDFNSIENRQGVGYYFIVK